MAIRPVYSKLVLPSRKSLEIIINIKIKKKKYKIIIKLYIYFFFLNGGCPLIRACSLIRSNTVCLYSCWSDSPHNINYLYHRLTVQCTCKESSHKFSVVKNVQ